MRVYDPKAAQKVPMAIAHDGLIYDVVFHFAPFTDVGIEKYFAAEEDGERSAAEVFFDTYISRADGVEFASREELIDSVPRADKECAVREGLLGAVRKALPKAQKKLNWREISKQQTYHLVCFFDGGEVETEITLNTPTAEHLRVFRALQNRSFPIRFGDHHITSLTQGLKVLFDALYYGFENYEREVPLHHQLLVMQLHLGGYRELILGK